MSSRTTTATSPVDVLVIGSGPAGLACTVAVSRLLHTAICFSNNTYRNGKSKYMHGVLTWEHRDAAEYRDAARKDILAHYDTVSFEDVSIERLEKQEKEGGTLFKATDQTGKEWWSRKVALCSGIRDIMPEIEGYEDCWADSIFHCLFCHGYEQRGSPSAGVLAMDDCSPAPIALHLARFANRLAEKVTIYTNGNETVTEPIKQLLSGVRPESKTTKCITVDNRKITKFVKGNKKGELTIFFEDGESKLEGFLTHKPKGEVNGPWKEQLGLEMTAAGDFMVNPPFGETNVKGVFAAGDSSNMMKAVALAISSGGLIAAGIATSIGVED